MTEQPIRRLDIFKDGRIVQYDRDEPGRGHAWMRMECLTLEEGVRRMGYVAPTAQATFPTPPDPKARIGWWLGVEDAELPSGAAPPGVLPDRIGWWDGERFTKTVMLADLEPKPQQSWYDHFCAIVGIKR